MAQFTTGFLPSGSRVPSGSSGVTIFGGSASIQAALNDSSDATGVHIGTTPDGGNHTFITTNHPGITDISHNRINYMYIQYRTRFSYAAGWIYPRTLVGLVNNSVRHEMPMSTAPVGDSPTAVVAITQRATTGAADGTKWTDCDHFEIEWAYAQTATGWDTTNYPYVTQAILWINYSVKPSVASISPAGSVATSRPAITWSVTNGPQSAYRLVLVPSGSIDAASRVVGDAAFDPTTVSGKLVDTGKTYSSSNAFTLTQSLNNGTVYVYIKTWEGSGQFEIEGDWASASMTIAVPTVDPPSVTLSDDTASNTLQVQIAPGSHTADQSAASIEVQYLDPTNGWVAAPIPGGLVSGTATSLFFDALQAPGSSVSYRARGLAVNAADGQLITSGWVTATHAVADPHQHWLRSTVDHTLNRSLSDSSALLVKTWQPKRTRPASVSYGVGASLATVVHDLTKADTHALSVWAVTSAAYDSLRALLDSDDDLILVSVWGETWRVQPVGDISEEVVRAAPRPGETAPLGHVRVVSFNLVEVVTP